MSVFQNLHTLFRIRVASASDSTSSAMMSNGRCAPDTTFSRMGSMEANLCVCVCVCVSMHVYECACVCLCTCLCTCVCTCEHAYV